MKRAFTTIELIVVLVLTGMVAAASFAGVRAVVSASSETEAKNALDRLILVERTWAAENGYFSLDALNKLDRDLEAVSGTSSGPDEISVRLGDDGTLYAAVKDSKGRCWGSKVFAPSAGGEEEKRALPGVCSADELR